MHRSIIDLYLEIYILHFRAALWSIIRKKPLSYLLLLIQFCQISIVSREILDFKRLVKKIF